MGIARDPSLRSVTQSTSQNSNEVKGQLFSMQYLDPGQLFSLTITYDDTAITQDEIIQIINNLKIGAKISAGFGDIRVKREISEPIEQTEAEIQTQISNNYTKWIQLTGLKEYIPIFCISDLIPTPDICSSNLNSIPDLKIYELATSKKQINLYFYNGSRSSLNQIDVIERGSVFLIHKKDGFQKTDIDTLAHLSYQRIGALTERGFGEIAVIPDYFLS